MKMAKINVVSVTTEGELRIFNELMPKSTEELKEVVNDLHKKWLGEGYKKPNDVPESYDKDRYRFALKRLGFNVEF